MAPITIRGGRTIGPATIIRVEAWPQPRAHWIVSTDDPRGRSLVARGWHAFKPGVRVGEMRIHVETRRSVLIRRYRICETLLASERLEVLTTLTACVWDIAQALDATGIGDGCVDWTVEQRQEALVLAIPGFRRGSGRRARRGQAHLRRDA